MVVIESHEGYEMFHRKIFRYCIVVIIFIALLLAGLKVYIILHNRILKAQLVEIDSCRDEILRTTSIPMLRIEKWIDKWKQDVGGSPRFLDR